MNTAIRTKAFEMIAEIYIGIAYVSGMRQKKRTVLVEIGLHSVMYAHCNVK